MSNNPFVTASINKKACPECGCDCDCKKEDCKGCTCDKCKAKKETEASGNPFVKVATSEEIKATQEQLANTPNDPNLQLKRIHAISLDSINPFVKKEKVASDGNPFVKEAREFQYTEQQLERKKDKNMVFPEGKQGTDKKDDDDDDDDDDTKSKGNGSNSSRYRNFDTVDRKEYRSSPDPKDIIPGYKEWYDREVDNYYDGWLDNHIENSGGSIPGSNTEKKMNLDGEERNHAPEYPDHAPYEQQLESRHVHDGDLTSVTAGSTSKKKRLS